MARKNIMFPQVLKNAALDEVVIIYWDRAEYYGGPHKGVNVYRGEGNEKFDPFHELEIMCLGNGFRFVHPARDNPEERQAFQNERIQELENTIQIMRNDCPEGGCLVEEVA